MNESPQERARRRLAEWRENTGCAPDDDDVALLMAESEQTGIARAAHEAKLYGRTWGDIGHATDHADAIHAHLIKIIENQS